MRTLLAAAVLLCAPLMPAAEPAAPPPGAVAAMTFNIRLGVAKDGPNRWEFRREMAAGVVRSRKPDFVGLQEAWRFQIDHLLADLPGYAVLGRSRQKEASTGEWCGILYRKDAFEPVRSGTFWLSDTPGEVASMSWGNGIPRICTWALFRRVGEREGATPRQLWVFNTHFDHRSQPSRERSAALVVERIAAAREEVDVPVLLLGDFNAGEDNPAIATLTGDADSGGGALADTFRVLHPDATEVGTTNGWNGRTSGNKIDTVFVGGAPRPTVHRAEIIHDHSDDGRYPSDHYPVWAVLSWE